MRNGRLQAVSLVGIQGSRKMDVGGDKQDLTHERPGYTERDLVRKKWGTTEGL